MPYEHLFNNLDKANLAEDLDQRTLDTIGRTVKEGYDTDKRSRSDWEDRNEEYLKLATQVVEAKNTPWPGAANIKFPLLSTAIQAFAARAYPALVPNANPVRGRIVGYDEDGSKANRAINVGKHMSYQLMEEMEEWEDDMDRMCHIVPLVGSCFKKTYFSPLLGRNVSELVLPMDLVVDYYAKNLETAYRKTQRIFLNGNELYERIASGLYIDPDAQSPTASEASDPTSSEVHGTTAPGTVDASTDKVMLECHTWYDLDDDGYEEPYVITIDETSGKVFRIAARYSEEGIVLKEDGNLIRIQPTEYYTKFSFLPSPDGSFYDLGFGSLLTPINETINTTINQLLDAGTMSNMQGGFLSRGIRIKGGDYRFKPGEWKVVNSTGDDLKRGIMPLPLRDPSSVLFSLLGMMTDAGRVLSSTVDAMVGEDSGQNQKATTTIAKIREGSRVFNAIYKRMHRSLKKEFKKLFELNKQYLPDEVYFTVLDPGAEKVSKVGRSDYQENFADVIPTSDPNVATEQERLAKAAGLFELVQFGTVNPQVATKRMLEAQDQHGIEELMTMPPPAPNIELELEKAKLSHQIQYDWEKLALDTFKAKVRGILEVAQAEAQEKGTQMQAYKQIVDLLDAEEQRAMQQQPKGGNESANQGGSTGLEA